jgi:hypothetical protein
MPQALKSAAWDGQGPRSAKSCIYRVTYRIRVEDGKSFECWRFLVKYGCISVLLLMSRQSKFDLLRICAVQIDSYQLICQLLHLSSWFLLHTKPSAVSSVLVVRVSIKFVYFAGATARIFRFMM